MSETSTPGSLTGKERDELANALQAVEETQTDFWDAPNCLENLLGIELDNNTDFAHYDVETLLEMQEQQRRKKAQ
jgi:hypothetical protein